MLKCGLQTLVKAGIFRGNALELLVTLGECIGMEQTKAAALFPEAVTSKSSNKAKEKEHLNLCMYLHFKKTITCTVGTVVTINKKVEKVKCVF